MGNPATFKAHHVAISVRDLDASKKFYSYFGFELISEWAARDKSLRITHMAQPDGYILELFTYIENANADALSSEVGNDLPRIGLKHFGFVVPNLENIRTQMLSDEIEGMTDVVHGETIDYFFLPDPDGNWVEILEDRRTATTAAPLIAEL